MYYPAAIASTWDGVIVAMCVALAPAFFISEGFGLMNFGYSKFCGLKDRSTLIPGKIGMFALYFPAALVFPLAAIIAGFGTSSWPATASAFHRTIAAMVTSHFLKRCVEVQHLHTFSGHTNLLSCLTIALLYLFTAFMFFFVAAYRLSSPADVALAVREGFDPNYRVGIAVWLCGISGNFYHHLLLSRLRAPGDTSYKVPTGGLFALICCPHYLFELVAWLGVALVFNHPLGFTVLWMMVNYLCGRAHVTLKWYRDRAERGAFKRPLPRSWRRILPYVF